MSELVGIVLSAIPLVFAKPLGGVAFRWYDKIGFDAFSERQLVVLFRIIGVTMIGFDVWDLVK